MNRFAWHRRKGSRKQLPKTAIFRGESLLKQKIKHGDYELSDYKHQAEVELRLFNRQKLQLISNWQGGQDSLQYRIAEMELKARKRYNRLMVDFDLHEKKMIAELQTRLLKEFGKDCWDEALENIDGSVLDLYNTFQNLATL